MTPPLGPAVSQNIGIGAARFLQGVGQFGHSVEGPLVVHGLGQCNHAGSEPSGIGARRAEGAADDFSK
jgi:hypothetical protein